MRSSCENAVPNLNGYGHVNNYVPFHHTNVQLLNDHGEICCIKVLKFIFILFRWFKIQLILTLKCNKYLWLSLASPTRFCCPEQHVKHEIWRRQVPFLCCCPWFWIKNIACFTLIIPVLDLINCIVTLYILYIHPPSKYLQYTTVWHLIFSCSVMCIITSIPNCSTISTKRQYA